VKLTLSARLPFRFLSVVNSHGWRQLAPFDYDENTNTLSYVLRLSNGRGVELQFRDGVEGVVVEAEKLESTCGLGREKGGISCSNIVHSLWQANVTSRGACCVMPW